ncbi:MAG: hypothetical protein OEY22_01540 [Candidatus Bathyarchaeota archaeon]|nr:hypothetical protein [Candidatus Bathyarchaeota archaeon]MDH5788332.1 hypothetical protein [Candidatus Bathyarchaeota archaeon]
MKKEEAKTMLTATNELSESYVDLIQSMKDTIKQAKTTKQLCRDGNKSGLIKLGLALIVFPEPTPISETIGSILVATGAVQAGIRKRSLYVDDVFKTFQNTMKEIRDIKYHV